MLDLDLVEVQLLQSLKDDKDVVLETYLLAYEEINKIFLVLGKVFKFVSSDVSGKIGVLRSKMHRDPVNYSTMNSMIKHEMSTSVIASDPSNGCRTLLRLHRALDFIAEFLKVLTSGHGSNISGPVWAAYKATLAKHHTWLIKNTVGAAMYTLPYKESIFQHINQSEHSMPRLVGVIKDVYGAVQAAYTDNNLLQLK